MAKALKSHNELTSLLSENSLIIVEFFDTSDGRCALLSSRLQSKVNCADVKIGLFRVDVQICPELAVHYKISKLPTIMAFCGTQMVKTLEGCVDDKQLDKLIALLITRSSGFCV